MSEIDTSSEPNYRAPIIEAVISFDCELAPNHKLEELKDNVPAYLEEAYPIKQNTQELTQEFKATKDGVALNVSPQNLGFRFTQENKEQLTQFKTNGFSFNRLIPYSSLDDYIEEIKKLWAIYLEVAKPVTLKRISMRYINRINIPIIENSPSLKDYFTVTPPVFPGNKLLLAGMFQSIQLVCPDSKANAQLTIATENPTEMHVPIIVDIEAFINLNQDPSSFKVDGEEIKILRDLKNSIYRTTLTQECQNLFQQ